MTNRLSEEELNDALKEVTRQQLAFDDQIIDFHAADIISIIQEVLAYRQAEKEQKPVAWMRKRIGYDTPQVTCVEWQLAEWNKSNESIGGHDVITPLYTHPTESINAELLEALQLALESGVLSTYHATKARAAIAKAQGVSDELN